MAVQKGQQIGGEHRRLTADRRGRLGIGHAGHIAQREDVRVAYMLQRVLIHLNKPGSIGQGAARHHIERRHRGRLQRPEHPD